MWDWQGPKCGLPVITFIVVLAIVIGITSWPQQPKKVPRYAWADPDATEVCIQLLHRDLSKRSDFKAFLADPCLLGSRSYFGARNGEKSHKWPTLAGEHIWDMRDLAVSKMPILQRPLLRSQGSDSPACCPTAPASVQPTAL